MIAPANINYERATMPGGYSPADTACECRFDALAAEKAVEFFPRFLRHVKGDLAGKPLTLEPWQANIVATLFGWKRKDGTRRYRTCFLEVPRKSGKTTMCAGLALYLLLMDNEPGSEVYSCAADREQAALVFSIAKENVLMSRPLGNRITPYLHSLVHKDVRTGLTHGTYKAISADAHTKHGYSPHGIIFDELHTQTDRELWDVMQTGRGARSQPLTVAITTAGYDRTSVCYEQYEYARHVRDGIIHDASFLPVVYEAEQGDDWTSPATWRKAQPNLGVSVPLSYYEEECHRAINDPRYENTFRRLYLDQWTEQEHRWIPMTDWDSCGGEIPWPKLKGEPCYIGIDFGWRDDYAALLAMVVHDGTYYAIPHFWLPTDGRRDKRLEPTAGFKARNLITLTPGNATDIEAIYAKVRELATTYYVKEIVIDPSCARAQGQVLMAEGYNVFEFGQSKKNYNEPCRFLESLLKEKRLAHGGHEVLRWMAANAAAEVNGLMEMMPKKKLSSEKIDGICALVMALSRAMLAAPSVTGSLFVT